jgi:tRNA modification GTPase
MTMATSNVAALLTPPGAGAIAVVRVAGPEARHVIEQLFEPADAASTALAPNRLRYGRFRIDGEIVDDVIVSQFVINGVPVADVSAHGGVRIVERILQALEDQGVKFEDAGSLPSWSAENKIELEILEALGRAKTERAVRFLSMQRLRLVCEIQRVAGLISDGKLAAMDALQDLLSGYMAARRLIEGVSIALVGPANSGKSTLFNALLGRGAAVVSQQPGTTRDWVEASLEWDGLSVRLIDSAGTREHAGELERQALEAGYLKISEADLRILVLDGTGYNMHQTVDGVKGLGAPMIVVLNKSDLKSFSSAAKPFGTETGATQPIQLSARMGTGVDGLGRRMAHMMQLDILEDRRPTLFTERQRDVAESVLSDVRERGGQAEKILTDEMIGV